MRASRHAGGLAALGLAVLFLAQAPLAPVHAQQGESAAPGDGADTTAAKPKRKPRPAKKVETKSKPAEAPAPAPAAAPATLADKAAAGAPPPTDVAAALKRAGAGKCADAIDAAAAPSMIGVTQSNMVSTWSDRQPVDKHAASVFIGQRYGGNAAVPFGATAIVASPVESGNCDMMVIQVVSSPLPCATVRTALAKGKQVADVAGVQLVQGGTTNTLLLPTGTNTCVLIDYKATYVP